MTPESRDDYQRTWRRSRFAAQLATELQVDFEDVAAKNIEKLHSRQQHQPAPWKRRRALTVIHILWKASLDLRM